jgi:site-specific recombinase
MSSVFAGWFSNWIHFQEIPMAIEHHPRLRPILGDKRTKQASTFIKKQAGGIASNLSLAFLLAMTPQIANFFGFPFDVRHVTLSSGALTAAAMAIGPAVFSDWSFWLAVGGVLSMGLLNLTVAFALALVVAIWAKKLAAPRRGIIYRTVLKKFIRRPWIFLFPPPTQDSNS